MDGITIGDAATRTRVSVHTLRYYERIGLIDAVGRGPDGHRRYTETDILWLGFLRRLRATGMSIAQMRQFAAFRRTGESTAGERRLLLEEHARLVRDRLTELSESLETVERKIAHFRRLENGLGTRHSTSAPPRQPRPRSSEQILPEGVELQRLSDGTPPVTERVR